MSRKVGHLRDALPPPWATDGDPPPTPAAAASITRAMLEHMSAMLRDITVEPAPTSGVTVEQVIARLKTIDEEC